MTAFQEHSIVTKSRLSTNSTFRTKNIWPLDRSFRALWDFGWREMSNDAAPHHNAAPQATLPPLYVYNVCARRKAQSASRRMLCNTVATCFDEHAENIFVSEKRPQLQRGMRVAAARAKLIWRQETHICWPPVDSFWLFFIHEMRRWHDLSNLVMTTIPHLDAGRKIRNMRKATNKYKLV
jgi:hypothetical protein